MMATDDFGEVPDLGVTGKAITMTTNNDFLIDKKLDDKDDKTDVKVEVHRSKGRIGSAHTSFNS